MNFQSDSSSKSTNIQWSTENSIIEEYCGMKASRKEYQDYLRFNENCSQNKKWHVFAANKEQLFLINQLLSKFTHYNLAFSKLLNSHQSPFGTTSSTKTYLLNTNEFVRYKYVRTIDYFPLCCYIHVVWNILKSNQNAWTR